TLRSPIPLEKDLQVLSGEGLVVMDGENLIAEVRLSELDMDVPAPPPWEVALAAQPDSFSFGDRENPLLPDGTGFHPICFCCGAENPKGLKVFAAPVLDNAQVVAVWQTNHQWAADDAGTLPPAYLWTALDCPGQFAYYAAGIRTGLLGRITAKILRPVPAGQDYLVTGWRIHVDGKKHFAGTAIFDRQMELVAMAKSVWIGSRPQV
ncbi:MAG: hotdog fold thioesterase, partial [Gammaproteobacteria bacterium]|nr:hotdog fold thioesterase [Gammaproteobacteria bacterium]